MNNSLALNNSFSFFFLYYVSSENGRDNYAPIYDLR